jgi:uncharacterized membrane protein
VVRHVSRRRLAALASLALATAFCVALVVARMHRSGTSHHHYLLWNLFLAWLPFVFALALYDADRKRRPRILRGGLALLWLLFLPNAPYLLTDLVHFDSHADPGVPRWYDAIMFGACGWTGLALAIGSLLLVHTVARKRLGAGVSWILFVPTLALVSFGIYLGRFVRLNSWDAIFRPAHFAHVVATPLRDPAGHPRFVGVTVLFTVFLMVSYLVVYTVAELRLEPEEHGATRSRRRA